MDRSVLARKPMTELKDIASHLDMRGYQKLRKAELIDAIVASATGQAADGGTGSGEGGETLFDQGAGASARKVLPPGARPDNGNGNGAGPDHDPSDAQGVDGAQVDDADDDADDAGDDTSAPSSPSSEGRSGGRERGSGRGRERGRGSRGGASADDDMNDTSDDDDDSDTDGGSSDSPRSSASSGASGSADDDEDEGGRKRSRRDRRKRTRDRGDDSNRDDASRDDSNRDDASRDADADDDDRDDGGRVRGGHDSGGRGRGGKGRDSQDSGGKGRDGQGGDGKGRDGKQRSGKGKDGQSKDNQSGGNRDNEQGEVRAGVLDILPEGYGFLRTTGYLPGDRDVYVSQGQIRKHGLRRGDVVQGPIRQQRSNEKVPALHHVQRVNGDDLVSGRVADRVDFRRLTAIHADEPLAIAGPDAPAVLRGIELLAPIGRGHRGLILAPYAGGRTELMKALANGLGDNSSDVHLMIVLVDERPEDVTDVERSVPGETISSTFDHPVDEHAQVAELALERAKRLVELGHDVVILLDSLTRLARAHGGGAAAGAVQAAKRFFGAARNVEEGGSLTILATLQTETGSEIDEVVARELQSTANVIIGLDGQIERSARPAVSPDQTQTLREERLLDDESLDAARTRRADVVGDATGVDATRAVINAFR